MDRKLLFVGVSLLSCFTSVHADDVLSHVIEYDGTQVSSRTDYTYDANGMVIEEFITRPSPSDPSVMSNYEKINYGYDSQKRRNFVADYMWNTSTLTFVGRPIEGAKTTSTYDDATGRVSEQLFYDWGTSDWKEDYSKRCVYTSMAIQQPKTAIRSLTELSKPPHTR